MPGTAPRAGRNGPGECEGNDSFLPHGGGEKIGICGQAPSDYPEFAHFLVEKGITSISLNPDTVIQTTHLILEAETQVDETAAGARAPAAFKTSLSPEVLPMSDLESEPMATVLPCLSS